MNKKPWMKDLLARLWSFYIQRVDNTKPKSFYTSKGLAFKSMICSLNVDICSCIDILQLCKVK